MRIDFDYKTILKYIFSATIMFISIRWYAPKNIMEIGGIIGAGCLVYTGILVVIGGFGKKELKVIKNIFK